MRRVLLVLLLGLLALPATSAAADTSDFTFDSFSADYTITQNADGTSHLAVVETLVAEFPDFDQNRGIIRAIPEFYNNVDLNTEVTSIVDETGTPVPYDEQTYGGFIELALGTDDFVHGETTYVISYTQNNVIGDFADVGDQEFYWDVNGTGWDQTFGTVTAAVHVDAALTPALTGAVACYRGATGSTDTCDIATDATTPTVTYSTSAADLGAGETVTVAIGFTAGTFVPGVEQTSAPSDPDVSEPTVPFAPPVEEILDIPLWSSLLAVLSMTAAFFLFVAALVARIIRASDNRSKRFIVAQYSVPKGLNVMTAAYLVGRAFTAVPAQIVSLAVRKNLRILDYPVTASGAEYTLQYLNSDGLDALEQRFMAALFGGAPVPAQIRELAPGDALLGQSVNGVAAQAYASLSALGFQISRRGKGCLVPLIVIGLILANIIAFIVALAIPANPAASVVAVVVIGLGALITGAISMTGRVAWTPEGKAWRDYLEGMRVYLTLAEQERFRMLQSPEGAERIDIGDTKQIIKLYEKLLPFAVIWGVEKEWAKELEVRVAAEGVTPEWFTGRSGFSAVALTAALVGVSRQATYSPQSNGGSSGGSSNSWSGGSHSSSYSSHSGGSHGGGHSGGGGGGGGGGGR